MQALNVQILEPQNAKIQSNKISSGRNSMGRGPSFKDMVKSMSKKESLASLEKNAPKNQPVNENDRHVENIEKAENVSSEVSRKSVKNTAEDNRINSILYNICNTFCFLYKTFICKTDLKLMLWLQCCRLQSLCLCVALHECYH